VFNQVTNDRPFAVGTAEPWDAYEQLAADEYSTPDQRRKPLQERLKQLLGERPAHAGDETR
jgi:hypothetical protein